MTWPQGLVASGGRLFFVADDGPHGKELWTSDGAEAGTIRVPGTSGIGRVYASGTGAYFDKIGPGPTFELWRSDGTAAGTSLVKANFDYVHESAAMGSVTYFATGNSGPTVLWRSDGTSSGTFQVFASDGQEPTYVRQLVPSNGLLFFAAAGTNSDLTLWRSDGTASGTWPLPVASISTALTGTLAAFGGGVAFAASDGVHGTELWTSDGTLQGTSLVRDLAAGSASSSPARLTPAGDQLYFTAFDPATGRELWVSDGSADGTRLISDLWPGPASTPLGEMRGVGRRLIFSNDYDFGLWTSDGTPTGTVALKAGLEPAQLSVVGSKVFFVAEASSFAADLWASDGSVAGTGRVRTLCPTKTCSSPRSLTPLGDALYFLADDGVYGPQLWRSDGSTDGTLLVSVVRPGPLSSSPRDFQEVDGTAFFLTGHQNGPGWATLWASDGTGKGTTAFATGISLNYRLVSTSRRLFWVEGYAHSPFVLMTSDGTIAGTGPVPVPPSLVDVEQPVCTDDTAFFFARSQDQSRALWAADGTNGGTRLLAPITYERTTRGLIRFGHGVVFFAQTGAADELWRSDGTAEGTSLLRAFPWRPLIDCSGGPRRLGRVIVFLADDGSTGCTLWRSDGTTEGTIPLGVLGGGASASIGPLASARGFLLFTNYNELWRTDGTPEGTFLLRSYPTESFPRSTGAGTHEGVFFSVQSNSFTSTTEQLWLSDGSVAGTTILHDFKVAPENGQITSLTTANGRLVASVTSPSPSGAAPRSSLWTSDGTTAGTFEVQVGVTASAGGLPYRGVTLFGGDDQWAGTELWSMDGSAFTEAVRPARYHVLTPCRVIDTRLERGFLGGPALEAGAPRLFPVGGACGIPATARSVAANVTVTGATSDGHIRIHAPEIGAPEATVLSFTAGRIRSNNATIGLGAEAELTIRLDASGGSGHVILDVVGWYE